jgi:hypothetical protein
MEGKDEEERKTMIKKKGRRNTRFSDGT